MESQFSTQMGSLSSIQDALAYDPLDNRFLILKENVKKASLNGIGSIQSCLLGVNDKNVSRN